jgi:hypothetical protein
LVEVTRAAEAVAVIGEMPAEETLVAAIVVAAVTEAAAVNDPLSATL